MKPTEYSERQLEIVGWPVKVTSYKVGDVHHAIVDNVSPGAWIARAQGPTQQHAEAQALKLARQRLETTKRQPVS